MGPLINHQKSCESVRFMVPPLDSRAREDAQVQVAFALKTIKTIKPRRVYQALLLLLLQTSAG